ncbi:MAG TPA: glycosyltransferase 87 family protein, partial [Dongiaceae bacterium]|nr:glycosyltransferase 87 family protein [Dongiaceae bacterium]
MALAALAHVAIVATLFAGPRPVFWRLHNDTVHRAGPGADFYGLYHAAWNMAHGASPYDLHPDPVTPYFYPFRYLPIVAEAGRPLLLVPPATAHRIWIVADEAILLALVLVLARRFPGRGLRSFAIVTLLLSSPFFLELYMGQFTFAAIALAAIGLLVPWGAPVYAAGSVLKVVPMLAAPALVRHRRTWPHLVLGGLGVIVL